MKVIYDFLFESAERAQGTAVIIDVYRAFTTACHVIANGAERLIAVGEVDEAEELRKANPDWILLGERGGEPLPGFNFGNSPALIENESFAGKTVVMTTSSGTGGLVRALDSADSVITGAFVNMSAIVAWLRQSMPETVTVCALGTAGVERSAEDDLCGIYIKNELEGFPNSFQALDRHLRLIPSAEKFLDPAIDWAPERDLDLCLELDRFDFVLQAVRENGLIELRKVVPAPQQTTSE